MDSAWDDGLDENRGSTEAGRNCPHHRRSRPRRLHAGAKERQTVNRPMNCRLIVVVIGVIVTVTHAEELVGHALEGVVANLGACRLEFVAECLAL